MLLPTGEVHHGCQSIAADALAIPTVVTPVNLTCATGVLGRAAAQFGAAFALQTRAFVLTMGFAGSCTQDYTLILSHIIKAHFNCSFSSSFYFNFNSLKLVASHRQRKHSLYWHWSPRKPEGQLQVGWFPALTVQLPLFRQ